MQFKWHHHYWILIVFIFGIVATFALAVIDFSPSDSTEIEVVAGKNYENEIDLFDTDVVHEISIALDEDKYAEMVAAYQDDDEKNYYKTNVTIDGITIPDVGVRLKGNLTLSQALGGSMGGGGGGFGGGGDGERSRREMGTGGPDLENIDLNNLRLPPNVELPENWESLTDDEKKTALSEIFESMRPEEASRENQKNSDEQRIARAEGDAKMAPGNRGMGGVGDNPPFLIKFDEFVDVQTYQGLSELAVRKGSDESLLSEPVAFTIHDYFGQIVPETAYAAVSVGDETNLYVICENPSNEEYVQKYFPGANGLLYKAENFAGFEYLGDDPDLYDDKFDQKTGKKNFTPLIEFLQFAMEATDEEFAAQLGERIDLDSFIRMMALDNLLGNSDSFVGMGSNYYLFYDTDNEIFTMLSWDQNLALGGMGGFGGGGGEQPARQEMMEEWMAEGGFDFDEMRENWDEPPASNEMFRGGPPPGMNFENVEAAKENLEEAATEFIANEKQDRRGGGGRDSTNYLKERFMANEEFLAMYEAEYARLKAEIFDGGVGTVMVDKFALPFIKYNAAAQLVDSDEYAAAVESKKSYFE